MGSEGKDRENFFRINVLVVDHIRNALVNMLKYYLCQKKMSFEDFIDAHMTDIRYLRSKKILYQEEVDKLIARSGITVDALEVTLVRRLLDNLCPDLFMDDGSRTLQEFLKKNQHNIYHLVKFNERCCQYSQHYKSKYPITEKLLEEDQYKKMFRSSSPCTNCAGTSGTVCSVASCIVTTEYIRLDYKIKCKVFGYFSPISKALQKFTNIRNEAYGHKEAAVIPNVLYDDYKKDIEENIMVLARICGNEDETLLALNDVQKRSCDATLCTQYQSRLIEQVQRDNELMEVIGENRQILQEHNQILQKIPQQIQELTEEVRNLKTIETNLTEDVGVSCNVYVGVQILQEASSLTSTPSSGNQSSQNAISLKAQINSHSQTQHQLDDGSLEHQNLQTLNIEIPSTSTQPPILGNQNLMNQTNIIERNNPERGRSQQVAVVTSGGLMRNSYSLVNPADDQAGAMTSCSPEFSSNNISTGNDQLGQGYQSSIETDAEPYISSVNNERVHDFENKRDGVVLHVEDDRVAAKEFIKNMKRDNLDLDIDIISYDDLPPGTSQLGSAANVFHSSSYLFIFETQNLTEAKFEMYITEIALVETLKKSGNQGRLIPVAVERDRTFKNPILAPLLPLKYYNYLEAKKSQQGPDQDFIKSFRHLITSGRKQYLVN